MAMKSVERKLEVAGLTKAFASKKRASVIALQDVDLAVGEGEFVCIVGASGCGKSTLLEIIAGFTEPTEGEVLLDGEPIVGPGPDRGFVFQSYSLYPWRNVFDNVAFGLELSGMGKAQVRKKVEYYLDVMNLTKFAKALPSELSGGMRQRTAIARSLATDPEVLLLDEPFGALDAQTKFVMQDFILDVWEQTHKTIVMVTHDVEEAVYLSQRIYAFSSHPGRVKQVVDVPFGLKRDRSLRRDTTFLDLRDEVQALLSAELVEV
jgi:NitT/TauT family transport system ATP-binding protein